MQTAEQYLQGRRVLYKNLVSQRSLPFEGWVPSRLAHKSSETMKVPQVNSRGQFEKKKILNLIAHQFQLNFVLCTSWSNLKDRIGFVIDPIPKTWFSLPSSISVSEQLEQRLEQSLRQGLKTALTYLPVKKVCQKWF